MSESSECLDKEDFNQALIEHVFCHPILYDPAHEDAKNNSKRERVWAGIASDLNESGKKNIFCKIFQNYRRTSIFILLDSIEFRNVYKCVKSCVSSSVRVQPRRQVAVA